jgi:SPP1 family predicted phage head-tail adaptor
MMRAGDLNRRATIQRPEATRSPNGDQIIDWVDVATVWANVAPFRTRPAEDNRANQILAEAETKFICRWHSTLRELNPKWRVRYQTKVYNIVLVINISEANTELQIYCKAGLNEG